VLRSGAFSLIISGIGLSICTYASVTSGGFAMVPW
jgi:hypothetical protein